MTTRLGIMLRLYRQQRCESIRDTALHMGIAFNTLARLERGQACDLASFFRLWHYLTAKSEETSADHRPGLGMPVRLTAMGQARLLSNRTGAKIKPRGVVTRLPKNPEIIWVRTEGNAQGRKFSAAYWEASKWVARSPVSPKEPV